MTTPLRSPDSNTQLIGQRVGEYRVLREVGRGGMGVVFEAVHNETGQQVAVKAIHESLLTNLSAVQRFVAEARLMGRVDHPGLTRVYDSGQLPGGRPYFVMEFLVGESLRERLRSKGRLGQKEAVAIGLSIAEALAAAHAAGIVHRDAYVISKVCFHVGHLGPQRRRNKPCPLTAPAAASFALTSH